MAWSFKLHAAPEETYNSSGVVTSRKAVMGPTVSLGKFIPRIDQVRQDHITVPMWSGNTRTYKRSPDKPAVRFKVDFWSETDWEDFQRILSLGRPLMISPGYDQYTWFASNFAGHTSGNLAEIGVTTYSGRNTSADSQGELIASPVHGFNQLEHALGGQPKLTEGMMGKALLVDRENRNWAAAGGWSASAGSDSIADTISNNPLDVGEQFYLEDSGDYLYKDVTSVGAGTVTATVAIRGTSTVQGVRIGVDGDYGSWVSLTDDWQLISHKWTSGGGTEQIRIEANGVASGQVTSLQVGRGAHQSQTILDYAENLSTKADEIVANNTMGLPLMGGCTFVFWFKPTSAETDTEKMYFLSGYDTSTAADIAIWLQTTSKTYYVDSNIFTPGPITGAGSYTVGEWTQLVVTIGVTTGSDVSVRIYENGASIANDADGFAALAVYTEGMYIGSGRGLGTPESTALVFPLDSARIDRRRWSDADVLDNYEMYSDQGVKQFLSWGQGMLFRPFGSPGRFAYTDTSRIVGELVLEPVGYIHQGAF